MTNGSTEEQAQKRTTLTFVGIALALVGLGFSVYTIMHHLAVKAGSSGDFSCNINSTFSCDAVAMSEYSEVMGIPLGVWGAGYFVGLVLTLLVAKLVPKNEEDCWHGYTALVGVGLLVSIVAGSISYFVVGAVCLACSGIYAVTILQAAAIFPFRQHIPWPPNFNKATNGGLVALVGVAVVVVGFNFIGPSLSPVAQQDLPMGPDGKITNLLPNAQTIKIHRSQYSGLGEDFRKGSEDAKVTIVEFADFECPACGDAANLLSRIAKEYSSQVQVVFKNYPLDKTCNTGMQNQIHPNACGAAKYARCAGELGKFWEFHDLLFQNQRNLAEMTFKIWAKQVGIQDNELQSCLTNTSLIPKIQDDIAVGNAVGVTGTPTIFINGRRYVGPRSYEAMVSEIKKLL